MKPLLFTSWSKHGWKFHPSCRAKKNMEPPKRCHLKYIIRCSQYMKSFCTGGARFPWDGWAWRSISAMNLPDLVLSSTFPRANMQTKTPYNTDSFLTYRFIPNFRNVFRAATGVLPPKNRQTCHEPVGCPTHIENSSLSKSSNLPGPDGETWCWVSIPRNVCRGGMTIISRVISVMSYLTPVNVNLKGQDRSHPTPRFCMDDWNKLGLSSSSYDLAFDVWATKNPDLTTWKFKHLKHKIHTDQTFTTATVQVSAISLKFKSGSSVLMFTVVCWMLVMRTSSGGR